MITDLVLLASIGIRAVLVHGGGPEINSWLAKVGIQAEFKNGLRVTDGESTVVQGRCGACINVSICKASVPNRSASFHLYCI